MKRMELLLAPMALAIGFILPVASSLAADGDKAAEDNAATLTQGAQAWADNCSRCHNLRSPKEFSAQDWDVIVTHMRVRANLSGAEAKGIKAFLMSSSRAGATEPSEGQATSKRPYADLKPGDVEHGRQIYAQTCVACHGADGKGAIPGAPDFTAAKSRLEKPEDILLSDVLNGYHSEGSPMAMPPKGGNPDLTEQDIADVLAYMEAQFAPKK